MWTIAMLKENAKQSLKNYFWVALAATVIVMLLAGNLLSQIQSDSSAVTEQEMIEIFEEAGIDMSGYDDYYDSGYSEDDMDAYFDEYFSDYYAFSANGLDSTRTASSSVDALEDILEMSAAIGIGIMVVALLVYAAYRVFFANPLLVGHKRFFLDGRVNGNTVGGIFSQFKSGAYGSTVKTMIVLDIKLFLWGLLSVVGMFIGVGIMAGDLVESIESMLGPVEALGAVLGYMLIIALFIGIFSIPQIIKDLEYTLVGYLAAENPAISTSRAFAISKKVMKGEKAHFFGLRMSFIGWYILAALAGSIVMSILGSTLGSIVTVIAMCVVYTYQFATEAEFYCCMREKAMATGICDSFELNGVFGRAMPAQPVYPQGNYTQGSYPQSGYYQNGTQTNGYQAQNYQSPNVNGSGMYPPADAQRISLEKSAQSSQPAQPVSTEMDGISLDSNTDYTPQESVQSESTGGYMDGISLEKDDDNYNGPEIM